MTDQPQLHSNEASPEDRLIQLENETGAVGPTKDINSRIDLLDASLDALQNELAVVSSSVDEGLERLGKSDLDLTSKVSDTYKRLGEIDSTYQVMAVMSGNIGSEVNKLTAEVAGVAAQSALDLEQQKSQFTRQHVDLADRINALVDHSQETSEQLTQSIKENTIALLKLEKKLVAKIGSLANATQKRSNTVEKKVENSKARIYQLQAVDDALERRALSLEASAAELTQKSRKLRVTVDLLDMRTDELSTMIDKLLEQGEQNASLIGILQGKSVEMAMSIQALAGVQSRHFKILSGAMLVAVIAIAGLYFYDQSKMSHDAVITADRKQVVDQHINSLQLEKMKTAVTVAGVQDKLVELNEKLEHEVTALNRKLQAMDDQSQTLEGRTSNMSSYSRTGRTNVIHGPQWLAGQPAEQFAVQVASVSRKADLYNIAKRYYRYLQDELSYYKVRSGNQEKYVLLSSGYATEADAAAARLRLPGYVNYQRPSVTRIGEVQKQL